MKAAAESNGENLEREATFLEHIMEKYNYNVEDVENVVNDLLLAGIDNVSWCFFPLNWSGDCIVIKYSPINKVNKVTIQLTALEVTMTILNL